jgi:methylated-DNA-[protein]-cysteine S-methyltransferase
MTAASVTTPIGTLTILAGPAGLRRILWDGQQTLAGEPDEPGGEPVAASAAAQLLEYFAGTRRSFDLPLDLRGTPFQEKAWRALATIPYGTTVSYAEQARRMGNPKATRAVGSANGRNPLPIVLPCHRVVGAGGGLGGFGGGLDVKRALLDLELGATARA